MTRTTTRIIVVEKSVRRNVMEFVMQYGVHGSNRYPIGGVCIDRVAGGKTKSRKVAWKAFVRKSHRSISQNLINHGF